MSTTTSTLPSSVASEQVERFDLDREGRPVLHVLEGAERRWYRYEAGAWKQLHPREDHDLPGTPPVDEPGCELLGWRPGRRMTLRVLLRGGQAILKLYRRASFAAAVRAFAAVGRVRSREALRTPVVLEQDSRGAALLLEHLRGEPPAWTEADVDLAYRTGAGLRVLQDEVSATDLPVHAPAGELAVLEQMERRLAGLALELPSRWKDARAELERMLPRAVLQRPVACHRDLHESQLLVLRDQQVALIDLDFLCMADPLLDVANLLAHLQLRVLLNKPGASQHAMDACGGALLEGLDRERERRYRERLRFYQAGALLRLALVHSMRPRSALCAPQLVALAERCLSDLRAG